MWLLSFLLIVAGFWIGVDVVHAAPPPIPELSRWESQMTQYGDKWCRFLQDSGQPGDQRLAATYYDAERVYFQIADYTRDQRWLKCTQTAEMVYRDWYLLANDGKLPGFWIFPHGIYIDQSRNQDATSKHALSRLALNAAYGNEGTPLGALSESTFAREVAYNLQTKLLAQAAGAGNFDASINRLAEEAFRHMHAWFIAKNAPFMQPFMVGLVCEALILYHSKTGDGRVLPIIRVALNHIWSHLWVSSEEAFLYIDRAVDSEGGQGAVKPAPDLNLLIAPAFAWVYAKTGDATFLQRGDQIFASGVRKAAVDFNAKQFNQNYRWSFAYVAWRLGKGDPIGGGGTGPEGHYRYKQPSQGPEATPPGHFRFKQRP